MDVGASLLAVGDASHPNSPQTPARNKRQCARPPPRTAPQQTRRRTNRRQTMAPPLLQQQQHRAVAAARLSPRGGSAPSAWPWSSTGARRAAVPQRVAAATARTPATATCRAPRRRSCLAAAPPVVQRLAFCRGERHVSFCLPHLHEGRCSALGNRYKFGGRSWARIGSDTHRRRPITHTQQQFTHP